MAGIRVDISELLNNLGSMEIKSQTAIRMYAQEGAKKFENYAKQNRPWADRTGHARQRLTGSVETLSDRTRIHIGHGVDYGIYLELANQKRFAILQKTVNTVSPEILKGFKEVTRYLK